MKERYNIITKDILLTIAIAGVFIVASTSPYFLINIARAIIKNNKYNKNNAKKIAGYLGRLKKSSLVIIREKSPVSAVFFL